VPRTALAGTMSEIPPREVQGLGGSIQRGEDIISAFLSLSLDIHAFNVNVLRAVWPAREKPCSDTRAGGYFVMVQIEEETSGLLCIFLRSL